jgi:hypothetical protein
MRWVISTMGFTLLRTKRRLVVAAVLTYAIFMLACGLNVAADYVWGAKSYASYRFSTTAPLFAGNVMMGFFGLLWAYKNRGSKWCLVGFGITVFCYAFIEWLFNVCVV